jgi:hypothetical protein
MDHVVFRVPEGDEPGVRRAHFRWLAGRELLLDRLMQDDV